MAQEIVILLSLYGESPFLGAFLESLDRQSFRNFRLLCRFDDGMTGRKNAALLARCPMAENCGGGEHLGVTASYGRLLKKAHSAEYLMFADQDDVWDPDKIEQSFACMRAQEERFGKEMPLLVHSDLRVCDQALHPVSPSLFRYQALNPERNSLRDLMIQNNVTGCSVMINRALAELADIPDGAICHDWYLALIASAFGRIVWIPRALADYRQHGGNVCGAVSRSRFLRKNAGGWRGELHGRLVRTQRQAGVFLKQFEKELNPEQRRCLAAWSTLSSEKNYLKRLGAALYYRFRKNDLPRTIGMWWAL